MDASRSASVLARKLNAFVPLSTDELRCVDDLQARRSYVRRGKQLTQEGQTGQKVFVLLSGWACSYKDLPNGSRQVISFPIAGDCVGLRSVLLRTADHSFSAITDATVSVVDGDQLISSLRQYPRLGARAYVGQFPR